MSLLSALTFHLGPDGEDEGVRVLHLTLMKVKSHQKGF